MPHDNLSFRDPDYWDRMWKCAAGDSPHGGAASLLLTVLEGMLPGRALDIGCGDGSNAILMAQQGWRVTAVDFSQKALESGERRAADADVDVEFVLADAADYRPEASYDLITSFYIQLPPEVRAAMLFNLCEALAPGGKLLFVSHDRSTPPRGWSETDTLTLTSVETVVSELHDMEIEFALVLEHNETEEGNREGLCDHIQHLNSTVVMGHARLPGQQTP